LPATARQRGRHADGAARTPLGAVGTLIGAPEVISAISDRIMLSFGLRTEKRSAYVSDGFANAIAARGRKCGRDRPTRDQNLDPGFPGVNCPLSERRGRRRKWLRYGPSRIPSDGETYFKMGKSPKIVVDVWTGIYPKPFLLECGNF